MCTISTSQKACTRWTQWTSAPGEPVYQCTRWTSAPGEPVHQVNQCTSAPVNQCTRWTDTPVHQRSSAPGEPVGSFYRIWQSQQKGFVHLKTLKISFASGSARGFALACDQVFYFSIGVTCPYSSRPFLCALDAVINIYSALCWGT